MNSQELLEYVRRAKDLEADIYQNQLLQKKFNAASEEQKPIKPDEPIYLDTNEPQLPTMPKDGKYTRALVLFAGIILSLLGSRIANSSGGGLFIILMGILTLFAFFILRSEAARNKAKYNVALGEYEKKLKQYRQSVDKNLFENQKRRSVYEESLEKYRKEESHYLAHCKETIDMLCATEKRLSETLDKLYAEGVIYSKYRNMVAVSTIYEYLESGRCSQLEGPDGAYNLYEMELRQNVIIGQLSSITDNLERIKENQFTLYNEIVEANGNTSSLLSDIGDDIAFSAYQNKAMKDSLETMKYLETAQYLRHR